MSAMPLFAVPEPVETDGDDVQWALSTARALWSSGNLEEALSWLRRAGESATDDDDDARAVELFKIAASIRASVPPPAAASPPSSGRPPPPESYVRELRPAARAEPPPRGHALPPLRSIPPPPPPPSSRPIEAHVRASAPPSSRPAGPSARPAPSRPPPSRPAPLTPPSRRPPALKSIRETHVGLGRVGTSASAPPPPPERPTRRQHTAPQGIPADAIVLESLGDADALSAVRFTVAAGPARGTVVLRVLGKSEDPPEGAPSAVIVPRNARDAERILYMLARHGDE